MKKFLLQAFVSSFLFMSFVAFASGGADTGGSRKLQIPQDARDLHISSLQFPTVVHDYTIDPVCEQRAADTDYSANCVKPYTQVTQVVTLTFTYTTGSTDPNLDDSTDPIRTETASLTFQPSEIDPAMLALLSTKGNHVDLAKRIFLVGTQKKNVKKEVSGRELRPNSTCDDSDSYSTCTDTDYIDVTSIETDHILQLNVGMVK